MPTSRERLVPAPGLGEVGGPAGRVGDRIQDKLLCRPLRIIDLPAGPDEGFLDAHKISIAIHDDTVNVKPVEAVHVAGNLQDEGVGKVSAQDAPELAGEVVREQTRRVVCVEKRALAADPEIQGEGVSAMTMSGVDGGAELLCLIK